MVSVELRVYGGLNRFVEERLRQRTFTLRFTGPPAVADVLAVLGLPEEEVALAVLDARPAARTERVNAGSRLALYPRFERLDVSADR